jgi:hypothetical protein
MVLSSRLIVGATRIQEPLSERLSPVTHRLESLCRRTLPNTNHGPAVNDNAARGPVCVAWHRDRREETAVIE